LPAQGFENGKDFDATSAKAKGRHADIFEYSCPRDPLWWRPCRRGQAGCGSGRSGAFPEGYSMIETTWEGSSRSVPIIRAVIFMCLPFYQALATLE
jgi:hypothetical protein